MRELCGSAKAGHPCSDDMCRGGGDTLCGFDQAEYDDLVREGDAEYYDIEDYGEREGE